ncbi:carboxypeptidase regulatory-like domain-containing protein [Candidatus Sumerlaeota bacterium]|nr:carboxypeptidase regulatory-like domain-containing protein [Candidatus Sumerlaeota bacterium]
MTKSRRTRKPWVLSSVLFVFLAAWLAACGSPSGDTESERPSVGAATPPASPVPYRIRGTISLAGNMDEPTGTLVFVAGTSYAAYADAMGRFAIDGVPPGAYSVYAQRPGYQTASLGEIVLDSIASSARPLEFDLATVEMQPEAGRRPYTTGMLRPEASFSSIGGRVVLPNGLPADNAVVRIEGTEVLVLTDSDGRFSLVNIQPGDLRLLAEKRGFGLGLADVRAEPDSAVDLPEPIRLEPLPIDRFSIVGNILFFDPENRAIETVEGAKVTLVGKEISVAAAPDGSFSIEGLEPDTYDLEASAPGFVQREKVSVDLRNDDGLAILRLYAGESWAAPSGKLTGVVALQGATGSAAGVFVALAGASSSGATDADGRFLLARVEPGAYSVLCKAEGYKMLQIDDVEIAAGQTTDLGLLKMERDVLIPEVLFSTPKDGTADVVIESVVRLALGFNTKMRTESIRSALSISPACPFSLSRATSVPEANPETQDVIEILLRSDKSAAGPRFKTRYTVTLAASAQSLEGTKMEKPFRFSFSTGGLRVLSSVPEAATVEPSVPVSTNILLRFNGRIDRDTLTDRNVTFAPPVALAPTRWRFDTDPATGWTILTIPAGWNLDKRYTLTLSSGVKADDGTALDPAPFVLRFRTEPGHQVPQGKFQVLR